MRLRRRIILGAAPMILTGCIHGRGGKKLCTESPWAIVNNATEVYIDVYYRTASAGNEIYLASAPPGVTRYEIPVAPTSYVYLSYASTPVAGRRRALEVSAQRVRIETSCDSGRRP